MSSRRAGWAPPSERRGAALKRLATGTALPPPVLIAISNTTRNARAGNTVLNRPPALEVRLGANAARLGNVFAPTPAFYGYGPRQPLPRAGLVRRATRRQCAALARRAMYDLGWPCPRAGLFCVPKARRHWQVPWPTAH